MRTLEDGGGIYTLGAQMGSSIERNYVHNQGNPYGSIYLDNGTQFYTVTENLVEKTDHWLLCTTYSTDAENNVVTGNYAEFDNIFVQPDPPNPNNTIADNTFVGDDWPPEAVAIAAQSGLEGEYRAYHPDELARGRPVTTSSDFDPGHTGPLANDGDGRTGWSPKVPPGDNTPWWQVDLGAEQPLAGIEVVFRWELDQPDTRRDLEIVGANQADASDAVVLARLGATPMPHRAIWAVRLDDPPSYRYVRVRKAGEGYMYLGDVRVLVVP
jgi:hypothetical protein